MGNEAIATANQLPPRLRLPRPLRRLVRLALGRKKRKRRSKPRSADDRAIAWLWPHIAATTGRRYPPLYEQPDAFILQMGRVGSLSMRKAMLWGGYNVYHSHGFSDSHCAGTLQQLRSSGGEALDSRAVRVHLHAVAHSALLRWYKQHRTRNGERLKIVTMTRDPVTWLGSCTAWARHGNLPPIRRWYAADAGLGPGEPVDDLAAMRAFGVALGRLILEVRPSRGLALALADLSRIAAERWPSQPHFPGVAGSGLLCADWFERQMKPVIGLDLLADPALRETGIARTETDYAEIVVLRFEDLRKNAGALGGLLGIRDFALPHVNATAATDEGVAVRAAFEAGIEEAGGRAVRRELRATEYARACGYDRLTD